jgi:tRNA(fMet)-specific endonuclease VapC
LSILLDTNACIGAISGREIAVRNRVERAAAAGERYNVSSIVVFELWYGIGRSAHAADNATQLGLFLDSVSTLPFDDEDARVAGIIRAELRKVGRPIGPYDVLIAGQAIRHNLTLITANVREFSRVPGLRWEDWSRPL